MSEPLGSHPPAKVRLTYRDYLLLPDDGKRHEIIDGDLFVTAAPVPRHQKISGRILFALMAELEKRGEGEVYGAPVDLVLSDQDVVQPDILFVGRDRLRIVGEKRIEGPPDLVVEVLSDSTRRTDKLIKSKLYASFGVPYYWIVDPAARSVETSQLADGAYRSDGRSRDPDILAPPGFAGLRLDLAEIFK